MKRTKIRINFHNHWVNEPGYETDINCRIWPILEVNYWNHGYGHTSLIIRFGWLFWTVTLGYFKSPIK